MAHDLEKHDDFKFDEFGEAFDYVSLDQVAVQARKLADKERLTYLTRTGWDDIVWIEQELERREDSYRVVLQFRQAIADSDDQIGAVEFIFDHTGSLMLQQVVSWPRGVVPPDIAFMSSLAEGHGRKDNPFRADPETLESIRNQNKLLARLRRKYTPDDGSTESYRKTETEGDVDGQDNLFIDMPIRFPRQRWSLRKGNVGRLGLTKSELLVSKAPYGSSDTQLIRLHSIRDLKPISKQYELQIRYLSDGSNNENKTIVAFDDIVTMRLVYQYLQETVDGYHWPPL